MATIVVGLDASPEARDALQWACAYAGEGDRILAVRAFEMHWVGLAGSAVPMLPDDLELAAREAVEKLLGEVGDDRIQAVVREGRPGPALVAEAVRADLIVVGHRGDSRIAMMLGSTANYVLHHSDVPTVVVRGDGGGDGRAIRRVVVGVDDHGLDDAGDQGEQGENAAVRALRWAYGVPGVGHIRVAHAWHLPPVAVGVYPAVTADFEALDNAAYRVIDRVVAAAGPAPDGVVVEPASLRSTPGWALVDESHEADLVVVGSRGVGRLRGLVLGSTSTATVAHARCPVCVVR
ncbi:MAG TPA: universal stress protein [Ilumatobacter sp.]|nr:universal stress protein [Ilumatobacter sp.]